MKYVCLVHFVGDDLESLSQQERHDIDIRSVAYDEELAAGGHLIQAQALQSPDSAVLVRKRKGRISTTDGPYSETKEQLAGFILVEARDLNEAIRIAGGIPLAELGTIEVRPIYEIPWHDSEAT